MSTPAGEAMSGAAGGGAPPPGGGAPPPGGGGAPPPGAGAAPGSAPGAAPPGAPPNPNAFWSGWDKPEQKETRDWAANKNYDSPFTLAKTAQQLEREAATLRAGKGYPVDKPGADGKPVRDEAAWKAWNTLTGVPESADKYDIPVPEANPYPEFKGFMAEEFLKAGVPAAMATQLAKGYESAVARMEATIQQRENTQSELGLAQLKDAWGANYQERIALASRGKEWLSKEVGGLNDLQLRTLESVLGTPKFLSAMWKIGAGNGEARFAGGDHPASGFTGGAAEAQVRFDQLMADRAAGKINDSAWREMVKQGGEVEQLGQRIAAGFAQPTQ